MRHFPATAPYPQSKYRFQILSKRALFLYTTLLFSIYSKRERIIVLLSKPFTGVAFNPPKIKTRLFAQVCPFVQNLPFSEFKAKP